MDSPLLFPAAGGGYIDLEKFRRDHWAPAISASGIEHHRIYDLRRSFASSAIAAGVSLLYLAASWARRWPRSTPLRAPSADSEDYLRGLLDACDERGDTETDAFSR